MKIAIDVHSIGTQAGGNETYFRQLVRGLADDQSDNRYTLFYTNEAALHAVTDARFTLAKIPQNPLLRICASLPFKLNQLKPSVFHCQYIQPPLGKTKTVVTIHDLGHEHVPEFFSPFQRLAMKKLVRWTARRADHILTVSHFASADISNRFGINPEKITVTYQAPSSDFRPRDKGVCQEHLARKYGISSRFILYVGRLQARKNLPKLVDAYARVRKEFPEIKLVLVGKKDWESERIFARIKELGLNSEIIFPGYVSCEDLPLFYSAAEVFVFPSLFEGFGLPVVESMASGIPTITSHGSSLEEVAGDGALLIEPKSVDSIANAVLKVLNDTELRGQLIERGLNRSRQFTAGELPAKALHVYRSIAGKLT